MNLLQEIFDILRAKKIIKLKTESNPVYEWNKRTKKQVKNLSKKLKSGEKIRICFSVVFDSVFPAENVFKKMLEDEIFEPFILVIPDVARGEENMFYQMDKTYKTLSAKYSNVYNSYDYEKKEFTDWSDKMDMCFFANPYDAMTHKLYQVKYNISKSILCLYVNYGMMPDNYARENIINLDSLNLSWKVFVDTKENLKDVIKYTNINGKNAILSGYCKMDTLNYFTQKKFERKKIILAPHHTVDMPNFPLSNFMEYSNFFLELPEKYPQIDFVFRPHPLLFVTLSKDDLWGKQKCDEYLNKISSFPNVEYQNGGDYFETFVNSSAIIHDCSSFLMEYLYTGHPCCYMLKSKNKIKEIFAPIGQECLNNYYKAFNEDDIIKFINNIVIAENDFMKENRIKFAKREIMINYPNATKFIIDNIKGALDV